jgi:hypothetical protein
MIEALMLFTVQWQFARGTPLCGPLVLEGRVTDLYTLFKAVTNRGGHRKVG